MAIEFNCPHCSAAIRVPDAYSGKRGSCPKCSQKLLVPDIVPPGPEQSHESTIAKQAASETVTSQADKVLPPTHCLPDEHLKVPAAKVQTTNGPPQVSVEAVANNDLPEFIESPATVPTISRKLRRKSRRKKSQLLYTLGIPVVCLILFFVVVGLLMYQLEPELKGTLKGNLAAAMEIPTATVSWSSFELTQQEAKDAAAAFELQEAFISSQMACRIGSHNESGLSVKFEIGEGFSWYLLNPASDLILSDWIRDNRQLLNTVRMQDIQRTGTELCRDKIRKANGEPVVFAAEVYRDHFGVNAHVGAFGSVVEAVAQNRGSVCFHEDSNGTLYFALPSGTTQFILRGRTLDGTLSFPGKYTVVVDALPVIAKPESDDGDSQLETPQLPSENNTPLKESPQSEEPAVSNDSAMMQ